VKYQGITLKRIAVAVLSKDLAPEEHWFPREGETELPDAKELADMLLHAGQALIGRPEDIMIAIIYEAPGVPGKQLNRSTPHRIDRRENLETLMQGVLADCVEDAKLAGQGSTE
jgi:hypothetical protein